MMVREDDLMGFLFKLPVFCVRIGSICAIAGSVVQARKCHWTNIVIYYDADNLFWQVGTDVKLMSMVKAVNTEAPIWYAQVSVS